MENYDILFGVVLRLPSKDGKDLYSDTNKLTQRLGEAISKEFKDIYVTPFGMEIVEPDGKLRILNKVACPVEDEDDEDIP